MKQYVVGWTRDIALRSGRVVRIKDAEIAVFRLSNGDIRAIENRCPHKGGPLAEGIISGHYVFCPLHDWKISLEDGVVQKPDTGCIRTYPVEVNDGMVSILIKEDVLTTG